MVIVYRTGSFPKAYQVNFISWATFITIILYAAAIISPYILCVLSESFFDRDEMKVEKPHAWIHPEISFSAQGTGLSMKYTVGQYIDSSTIIPQIKYSRQITDDFISVEFLLPLTKDQDVTFFDISIPITVTFNETMERNFSTSIIASQASVLPLSKAEIIGSLKFVQADYLHEVDTSFPLSKSYLEYAKTHMVRINSSFPSNQGQIIFNQRDTVLSFCESCLFFSVSLYAKIPTMVYRAQNSIWFSLLMAFTTYLALLIPFWFIARYLIYRLLESGLITVQIIPLAEKNHDYLTKFNR